MHMGMYIYISQFKKSFLTGLENYLVGTEFKTRITQESNFFFNKWEDMKMTIRTHISYRSVLVILCFDIAKNLKNLRLCVGIILS